ncbi:hypothetical protein LPJ68_004900, partial [Coemansia sp. RSA 1086]
MPANGENGHKMAEVAGYYAGDTGVNGMSSWTSSAYQAQAPQANSAVSDTECSSPQDTPLAKIIQNADTARAQPTPPPSASNGLAQAEAWRAYQQGSYQQSMSFATSMAGDASFERSDMMHASSGTSAAMHSVPTHHPGIPDIHQIHYSHAPQAHDSVA